MPEKMIDLESYNRLLVLISQMMIMADSPKQTPHVKVLAKQDYDDAIEIMESARTIDIGEINKRLNEISPAVDDIECVMAMETEVQNKASKTIRNNIAAIKQMIGNINNNKEKSNAETTGYDDKDRIPTR